MSKLLTIFFLTLIPFFSMAHPVAFRGSIGVMGQHAPELTHHQVNYSIRHWVALGVHHFRRPDLTESRHATFASSNFLLKRWNGRALQANLYALLGAGQSELLGAPETAGLGKVQFDIEDRKYYFLTKHLQIATEDRTEFRQTTVRAGLAPYQDPYDGIHSWIILDWQKRKYFDRKEKNELTPFLRVFYRNLLFEFGQSFAGNTRFNFISHF